MKIVPHNRKIIVSQRKETESKIKEIDKYVNLNLNTDSPKFKNEVKFFEVEFVADDCEDNVKKLAKSGKKVAIEGSLGILAEDETKTYFITHSASIAYEVE
jgi:hypothetical protein